MRILITTLGALGLAGAIATAAAAQNVSPEQAHVDHRRATISGSGMVGVTLLRMQQGLIEKKNVPQLFEYWATGARLSVEAFRPDTRGADVKTEAKDAIWANWSDFEAAMTAYADDVEELAALAADGKTDEALGGMGPIFKNHCRGCHNDYRTD